jgi:penicillin-binding protein 1A
LGRSRCSAFANVCAYAYLKPALPDVDTLRDVQLQVPLRVYTRDGRLIASIGEQRRIPVRYEQIPKADPGVPGGRGRSLLPAPWR